MPVQERHDTLAKLQQDIFAMDSRPAATRDYPAVSAPPPPPAYVPEREPFGRWLLAQRSRGDWIDELAAGARRDPGFPKDGSAEDIRNRLKLYGAEGDVFEQLEDAERAWLSC